MSDNNDSAFPYHANHAAPILFSVLFGLTLIAHIVQAGRARALFMLTLIIGTSLEVLGYVMRYLTIIHDPQIWSLAVSQVAIIVAPSFISAQDYMIVGRMMSFVGPQATWISHTVITKLFVIVDIACVLTQAIGATMVSGDHPPPNVIKVGRTILIAGLLLQIGSFALFVVISIFFDLKAQSLKGAQLKQLRPLFTAFYISAALIIGRSIYRTIEFATLNFANNDHPGYLWEHEWPYYCLDAVPILISIAIFNFINPSSYLPRKKGLRMDGTVEPPRKHWWSKIPAEPSVEHKLAEP